MSVMTPKDLNDLFATTFPDKIDIIPEVTVAEDGYAEMELMASEKPPSARRIYLWPYSNGPRRSRRLCCHIHQNRPASDGCDIEPQHRFFTALPRRQGVHQSQNYKNGPHPRRHQCGYPHR